MSAALVTLVLLLLATPAFAQTGPPVVLNINKAAAEFTWVRGTNTGVDDGVPTFWRWYCGTQPGAPGVIPVDVPYVPSPTNTWTQPMRPIVKVGGDYYCRVLGFNGIDGLPSNEVFFGLRVPTVGVTGLVVKEKEQ